MTYQTGLFGGEVAAPGTRAPPEQIDLMAGQVVRQAPPGTIGNGQADFGLEGLPLQAAADAAARAEIETNLFSGGENG